jgi:hypothetical protein
MKITLLSQFQVLSPYSPPTQDSHFAGGQGKLVSAEVFRIWVIIRVRRKEGTEPISKDP